MRRRVGRVNGVLPRPRRVRPDRGARGAPVAPGVLRMATVSERTTEDLIRRFHHELWGAGDISAIDRYVAPDAVTAMTGFEGSTVDVLREDVERYVGAFDEVDDGDPRPDRPG